MYEKRKLMILTSALILYLILGAELFLLIEGQNKKDTKLIGENKIYLKLRSKYNISANEFTDLSKDFHQLLDVTDYFGAANWTFYLSLYFCGSVVTTIGYGHITPKTAAGKITCIIYAVFGIPLTLWVLKAAGEGLNMLVEKLIASIEKQITKKIPKRIPQKTFIVTLISNITVLFLGGYMYHKSEAWSFIDGIYYCFTVYSTIGFGDLVPNEGHGPGNGKEIAFMFLRLCFLVVGLIFMSSLIASALKFSDDMILSGFKFFSHILKSHNREDNPCGSLRSNKVNDGIVITNKNKQSEEQNILAKTIKQRDPENSFDQNDISRRSNNTEVEIIPEEQKYQNKKRES